MDLPELQYKDRKHIVMFLHNNHSACTLITAELAFGVQSSTVNSLSKKQFKNPGKYRKQKIIVVAIFLPYSFGDSNTRKCRRFGNGRLA